MLKHFAVTGFAIAVATSAQAVPRAALHADSVIIQVREGCGIGMILVDGQCVSRHDLRVQHRVDRRMERRDYYGAYGTAASTANPGNTGDNCYRSWDQDARNNKNVPCSSATPAFVDTPGVRAILRARETWGQGTWYPYALNSGITCTPGGTITMGGQEYLCQ